MIAVCRGRVGKSVRDGRFEEEERTDAEVNVCYGSSGGSYLDPYDGVGVGVGIPTSLGTQRQEVSNEK
jgi:hypothetical protein